MATRKTDWINNFWKSRARPANPQAIWTNIKKFMGPGALDPLTKDSCSGGKRLERLPVCIASARRRTRNKA